ncbi:hypothetical protein SAMN05216326_11242 [Nitrosomonas marina]|uniref:CDP-Glycerol:Poly(Glycerophosphate) glycerophosphotransferase n=1 Tax=Nitrosomonas marina TaxID=917 RepID=A0A1I0BW41_9PROT|nr:hypothetical protein [Nitrosomonas marina]SET11343.1 hypothetical protein SAMN05216326_11242 [Nitrosomonas marina]
MKVLFFLRHYNDIDHITPVIYKWAVSGHACDVVLIGSIKFRRDYRIQFLKQLAGVRVAHIREVLGWPQFIRWRLQMYMLTGNVRRIPVLGALARRIAKRYDQTRREQLWRRATGVLLNYCFEDARSGVITFDWVERNSVISVEWINILIEMAHARALSVVSLPHGDSPHVNQLIRRGERRVGPDTVFSNANIFDRLVVPNELCAKRFRPFLEEKKIAVLGSPRFCEEWLIKLPEILPSSPITRSDSRLKIVLFLRKANFTTFWEEVTEVVHLIAEFPGTEIIIKPHTRSGWKQSLTRDKSVTQLPNVHIADDHAHSAHLMDWADVIIDLATSVVFEAVRTRKPVLAADYLIAGRSTVAYYLPETELRCRDDVYEKINHFITHGCDDFYVEEHRQRFFSAMLDVPDKDVLQHYVALLEESATEIERHEQAR